MDAISLTPRGLGKRGPHALPHSLLHALSHALPHALPHALLHALPHALPHALIYDSQGWSNTLTDVMHMENISQEPSEPSELHLPKNADASNLPQTDACKNKAIGALRRATTQR